MAYESARYSTENACCIQMLFRCTLLVLLNFTSKYSRYRISSYSFHRNYTFLNLEIQRSQKIRPKVTVQKGAETIQGRKLYEEIRYLEYLEVKFNKTNSVHLNSI